VLFYTENAWPKTAGEFSMMARILNVVAKILGLTILLCGLSTAVQAGGFSVQTPPHPPLPPDQRLADTTGNGVSVLAQQLPQLKAVLLVGPIDGDNGEWTTREKEHMELAALELEANGVEVHRFYTPNNDWGQIKAAAEGAHFLLYRGHGVYWSPMPSPTVGGFALKDHFASADNIREDLHLAPNAIVMLYGCFTAGSSSIDGGSITSQEAQRRVAQYSEPFFDVGAGAYFADWFGDAFRMYVRYLFQGMTLDEAYEAYFDFNATTVERYHHPDHPEAVMWLDKDDWGYMQYNDAFVGLEGRTLVDLFGTGEMTLSSTALTYLAEPTSDPRTYALSIDSTGSASFNWTASVSPADVPWLSVEPAAGSVGQDVDVVITPTGLAPGTYQARVRITADSPDIANWQQDVIATLHVLQGLHFTYLPAALIGGR
jgi:hypothetical protein